MEGGSFRKTARQIKKRTRCLCIKRRIGNARILSCQTESYKSRQLKARKGRLEWTLGTPINESTKLSVRRISVH